MNKKIFYGLVAKNYWLKPILGKRYAKLSAKYLREKLKNKLVVNSGPFKGMRYPHAKSAGSSFLPKIIGSYEKEISSVIDSFCDNNYKEIIDIGCAEGYYAVGLAMRIQGSHVYAFDINKKAIFLCKQMAELNQVGDRISYGSLCDQEKLKSINLSKALIICDCEGYEKQLFTEEVIPHLSSSELLIEVHDLIHSGISDQLKKVFKNTHHLSIYKSISDYEKAEVYDYEEVKDLPFVVKQKVLAEGRGEIMEWFHLKPINY